MTKDIKYSDPSRNSDLPEYDSEAASSYVQNLKPIKRQRKKANIVKWILISVTLSALLGVVVYWFLLKPETEQTATSQEESTSQQEQTPAVTEVSETEYSSASMNLKFKHKSNWQVDDMNVGIIKVESPVVKIADINDEQNDAKVVISFLEKGSEIPGFDDAGARAINDSEILTYLNPSQVQRAETYLTFASFGAMGLDSVIVTGDSGYKNDQFIPEDDVKKGDPIILIQFYGCDDLACQGEGTGSYTVDGSEWSANEALLDARSVLESLRVEL